jgi:hypothetical protein
LNARDRMWVCCGTLQGIQPRWLKWRLRCWHFIPCRLASAPVSEPDGPCFRHYIENPRIATNMPPLTSPCNTS